MTALTDQLPALIGVIVGALGATVSSMLTDRLRWRRDQTVRWDQRRLDSYVAFTATLKDAVRLSYRLTARHRKMGTAFQLDRAAAIEGLEEAERRNSKDWEMLLLLGDADTVEAARRWREAAGVVTRLALRDRFDQGQWDAAVHELDQTRDGFHAAARRDLGVTGAVDQFSFLRHLRGDAPIASPDDRIAGDTTGLP
jgi:hypothetical protein